MREQHCEKNKYDTYTISLPNQNNKTIKLVYSTIDTTHCIYDVK